MKTDKFFTSGGVQEKAVEMADGSVEKLPFKKVGSAEWTRFQAGMASQDAEQMSTAMLRLVWFSLCEPDGSQALTWDQVKQLDQTVLMSMYSAAMAVNATKTPGKT
jgi:hypothetical protein